jgi:hypothetical protein
MAPDASIVLVLGEWHDGYYPIQWERAKVRDASGFHVDWEEHWYLFGIQTAEPLTREHVERVLGMFEDEIVTRTISEHEMDRRRLLARAHAAVIVAMERITRETDGLTALEWCQVLGDCQQRICNHGLRDEWSETK